MSNGPVMGAFQCKYCGDVYFTKEVNYLEVKRYQDNLLAPKRQILDFIRRRSVVTWKILHHHFPGVPVVKIVNELVREGKVEIQQSGYKGHSLAHGKLLVAKK